VDLANSLAKLSNNARPKQPQIRVVTSTRARHPWQSEVRKALPPRCLRRAAAVHCCSPPPPRRVPRRFRGREGGRGPLPVLDKDRVTAVQQGQTPAHSPPPKTASPLAPCVSLPRPRALMATPLSPSPDAAPIEVIVATRTDAAWYAAAAILGGGLVVTAVGASRAAYRPKASLRAQPLRVRTAAAAEVWLLALSMAVASTLALAGHWAVGAGEGTAWGRLLPSVGLLALVVAVCPIPAHPSWAAAAEAGPLRTWVHSVPLGWVVVGVGAAGGGLALMGVTETWDALAANVVAFVIAWLHPFRPALRASPSRVGEDVGDGLLLLPGLFGAVKAYTLDGDDGLLLAAVPVEEESERASGGLSTASMTVATTDGDGDGDGGPTVLAVEPPAARPLRRLGAGGNRVRSDAPSGRRPFPPLRLPDWESLSLADVAAALYASAAADAGALSVSWEHDRTRLVRRWSIRAMLSALLVASTGVDAALDAASPQSGSESDTTASSRPPLIALSEVLQQALGRPPTSPSVNGSVAGSTGNTAPPSPAPTSGATHAPPSATANGGPIPPRSNSTSTTGDSASTDMFTGRFETIFDRLYALGTLGMVLDGLADASDRQPTDGAALMRYNEWINELVYAEELLTLPTEATVEGAAGRGTAALAALERIYRPPGEAAAAFYAAENAMNRKAVRDALAAVQPPTPAAAPPPSPPPPPSSHSSLLSVASPSAASVRASVASPSTAAVPPPTSPPGSNDASDADAEIPWPFVAAAAVLVRYGDRSLWSGDTEVPVVLAGAYSSEGIRRAVSRGLVLVQATTYAYALAGAVATELLA